MQTPLLPAQQSRRATTSRLQPPAAPALMPLPLSPPEPPTATHPPAAAMKVFAAAALLCLVAAASARMAYQLPADAVALVRSGVREVFSCQGRAFGYYADVANDCRIFHVCQPIADEEGQVSHAGFMAGGSRGCRMSLLAGRRPRRRLGTPEVSSVASK